ncbi:hypothetical protein GW915_00715 [bacterium]|nr:hypothetical protein [bacterium]
MRLRISSRKNTTIVISFLVALAYSAAVNAAGGWVYKVNSAQSGAIVKVDSRNHRSGEVFEVYANRRLIGKAKFIRYSKSNPNYGLVQVVGGTIVRGAAISPSKTQVSRRVADDLDLDYFDDSSAERDTYARKPASSGNQSGGYLGANLGYDYEFKNEFVGGGFALDLQGGFKMTEDISLGLRFGYSRLSLDVPSTSVTTTTTTTTVSTPSTSESFTALYFLLEGDYWVSKELHFGPTAGFLRASYAGSSDTSPALGAKAAYDYFVNDNLSIAVETNLTYVFDDEDFMGFKIGVGAKYWF